MSSHPSRSASSPAGPFTALKNAAVGTANRLQDINQHAANYVVDTLRGRSTRKRSRSSSRSRSKRRRRSSSGRKMQDDLMDIHDEEKDLRDERRKLDEKTLKMFERGLKKAEAFDKQLDDKISKAKTFAKDKYLDRWEQRYHTHMTRVRKEQKARVADEIQYFKRNIAIFKERIEVSTTTETLEQNVTDTLYTRNFVTIVGAELETKAGKVITQENATFLDKFSTFRVVFTIETKYQKKHSAIVRTSDEVADLHRVVKLYVPSVMRKVVRDIKDAYAYFKTHLEVLMDEWWVKQGATTLGTDGVTAATIYGLTEGFKNMYHKLLLGHMAVLSAGFATGGAVLGVMVAAYIMYRLYASRAGANFFKNRKLLKQREEHLQRKMMEATLFLNYTVFFVALAEARRDVDIVMELPRAASKRRSRSSRFANRRSSRTKSLQRIEQEQPKPYKPKGIIATAIRLFHNKSTREHANEPFEVNSAKKEIAKFFKQDDPARFFKPIVDVLKVELLKAKQLELKDQTRTDASDEIKELESEIRKLKP